VEAARPDQCPAPCRTDPSRCRSSRRRLARRARALVDVVVLGAHRARDPMPEGHHGAPDSAAADPVTASSHDSLSPSAWHRPYAHGLNSGPSLLTRGFQRASLRPKVKSAPTESNPLRQADPRVDDTHKSMWSSW
jgi:hypothetical protein